MDHLAGLDVSVKETSICIVDDTGKIVREVKVASEPEALLAVLKSPAYHFKRIGLEAGPLSQWLFSALAEADLPVICVETRHMRAVLKAQINKTDRNDARGIAQMIRVGLYRPVHVKTLRSQKLRMLLTHRKLLQSKAIAIDNDLRGTLRNFGLKVGVVGKVRFEARIRELVENVPDLAELVEPLLVVRRALREQFVILHRRLLAIVRDDEVCRRLITTPGVGPVVALTYRATVDVALAIAGIDARQRRLRRQVIVPDVMMHGLERPHEFAGLASERDHGIGVLVIPGPFAAPEIRTRRRRRQEHQPARFIRGHWRPDIGGAGADAIVNQGVEAPARSAGSRVEGAHHPERRVDADIVRDRGADHNDATAHHRRGRDLEFARPKQRLADVDLHFAILAEIGAGNAGLRVQRDDTDIVGAHEYPAAAIVAVGWALAGRNLGIVSPLHGARAGIKRDHFV